jgi:hypothetical protein
MTENGFHRGAVIALLVLFLLLSFLPDLIWTGRKTYSAVYTGTFQCFTVLHRVPGEWFVTGGSGKEDESLPYVALLRLVYALVPDRLLCLRVLSVAAALAGLALFGRIARILFSRKIALIFLFLLATSPVYLESMRAYGYHSLSYLAAAAVCYLTVADARRRMVLKTLLLAFFSLLTMSLYIASRAVIGVPLAFFALDGKRSWRRLLLLLLLLFGGIPLLELAFNDPLFSYRYYFYDPPEPGAEWVIDSGRFSWPMLVDHVRANAGPARDYLLGRGRRPFSDRDPQSRIFDRAYVPFLILGLLSCARRERRGVIFLAVLLLFFFIAPLASSFLQPRRIIFALYPLYLLIALGLETAGRLLARLASRPGGGKAAAAAIGAFLLAVGGVDGREYLLEVSRPPGGYGPAAMKQAAKFLSRERRETDIIRYPRDSDELVMGNPYFVPRPAAAEGAATFFGEERIGLDRTMPIFLSLGRGLLYLIRPPLEPLPAAALQWARKDLGALLAEGELAGLGLRWASFHFERIAPDLLRGDASLAVSPNFRVANSERQTYNNELEFYALVDMDPSSRCDIALDPNGKPVWLSLDLGRDHPRAVREVVAVPATGAEDRLFRRAVLRGSADGVRWETVAELTTEGRAGTPSCAWSFPNPRRWRYYRFEIRDRAEEHPGGIVSLAELWMFDRTDRDWKAEELIRKWAEANSRMNGGQAR